MRRAPAPLAALLAVLLLTSACGLHPASAFVPPVEPGAIRPVPGLADVRVRVTSKEFTEQLVLGKIAVLALTAAGAQVSDQTNVQGSVNARASLTRADADLMWEYVGTGWVTYLGQERTIPDPRKQYEALRDLDARRNDITWLPPAALNNTYAVGVTRESAAKYGLRKISDITKVPQAQRTFCVDHETFGREDGFLGMLRGYGLKYGADIRQSAVRRTSVGVLYNSIASGVCTMGMITSTDGRVRALDLVTLEDDRKFFPAFNACLTVRGELLRAHPEIARIFAAISERLTDDVMRALNAQVDVDGGVPVLVAKEWLVSQGFVN
ncbi:glycine/betaine ABC transporter substrate-binding protein [Spongiactinospora gelatinilytica]|uniref:Glycine/betaine ABC transporter substrate-binding protein n=1 Tax=Spongiactinospora gelatinilytica TaxID=2666298 RepID=A0A2W2HJA2_9ACTN|nr:glycine betaine ABC transporter substrate-binding protein [Spongiactinospora gelatinilytica]PZG49758.1 glycine/betaine ABC transporter substrate-binding protein [Spongiactinospora gelatinilytica]